MQNKKIAKDSLDSFMAWERKLSFINHVEYLEKQALSFREFNRWKHSNQISNYDERVLIKLYELETKCKRLERIILEKCGA